MQSFSLIRPQRCRRAILALAALLLSCGCSQPEDETASVCTAPPAPVVEEAELPVAQERFASQLEALLEELQTLRPPALLDALMAVENDADFELRLKHWEDRHFSARRLQAEALAWQLMEVTELDFDYPASILAMLPQPMPFFYDDGAHELVVRQSWLEAGGELRLAVRELVYALQHRIFGLDDLTPTRAGKQGPGPLGDDHKLAWMAVVQGDALGIWAQLEKQAPTSDDPQSVDAWLAALRGIITQSEPMRRFPPMLQELLLFPELEGFRYTHRARALQPEHWREQVYQNMPRSTQAVLYASQSPAPNRVALDVQAFQQEGDSLVYENSLGALGWRAWLRQLHCGETTGCAELDELAQHWRADRLYVWSGLQGERAALLADWADAHQAERVASLLRTQAQRSSRCWLVEAQESQVLVLIAQGAACPNWPTGARLFEAARQLDGCW
ncbi:MAG: hypothetical protein RBU37_14310 [Myxococcota bacterium]|jgi:hypothetical protein|nr:hypothetical protein [Myxococcota bacterium]